MKKIYQSFGGGFLFAIAAILIFGNIVAKSAYSGAVIEDSAQLATHQWVERDPNYEFVGYTAVYRAPTLSQDPERIEIILETTNVHRMQWENLTDESMPCGSIKGAMVTDHVLNTRLGFLGKARKTFPFYGSSCGSNPPGLAPFDGIVDGDGFHHPDYLPSSGWTYTCPGPGHMPYSSGGGCIAFNIAQDEVIVLPWSAMSDAEKSLWRRGNIIQYRPSTTFSDSTTVAWESDHGWWNNSDVRVSAKITFRAVY